MECINLSDSKNGVASENLRGESDGLAGELYSDMGWIKKYSHQRQK
jgi:hypothetical protein